MNLGLTAKYHKYIASVLFFLPLKKSLTPFFIAI